MKTQPFQKKNAASTNASGKGPSRHPCGRIDARTGDRWVHVLDAAMGGLGWLLDAENQVVGANPEAKTDQAKLFDVRAPALLLPMGDCGLLQIAPTRGEPTSERGLSQSSALPRLREAKGERFGARVVNDNIRRLIGPKTHVGEVKASEPLILVALRCSLRATLNERGLAWGRVTLASCDVPLNQFDAHAGHTVSMRCDARYGVDGAAHLDVAVGEVADVEVVGHLLRPRRLQLVGLAAICWAKAALGKAVPLHVLRPDALPVFGPQVLERHSPASRAHNGDTSVGGSSAAVLGDLGKT